MNSATRFVRACLRQPVDRPPVWFLRQAGRYMAEYREVRKHHTLVEICKQPDVAAEVTITAAEKLGVDAAIIFADLLLPLEPMGLDFEFVAGEGPCVHKPLRTPEDIDALQTHRANELEYVGQAIEKVAAHFKGQLGMIGFAGSPFTLASYMIEGGSSRNYIFTKQLMYSSTGAWDKLLDKIVEVLIPYCQQQVSAGADVIQIFDSWVGSLSVADYRDYVLPVTKRLIRAVQEMGVPVIYFGVDSASLLPASLASTGAPRSMARGSRSITPAQSRATSTPSPSLRPCRSSKPASARSWPRLPAAPGTSSTSATASSPALRLRTSLRWSKSSQS